MSYPGRYLCREDSGEPQTSQGPSPEAIGPAWPVVVRSRNPIAGYLKDLRAMFPEGSPGAWGRRAPQAGQGSESSRKRALDSAPGQVSPNVSSPASEETDTHRLPRFLRAHGQPGTELEQNLGLQVPGPGLFLAHASVLLIRTSPEENLRRQSRQQERLSPEPVKRTAPWPQTREKHQPSSCLDRPCQLCHLPFILATPLGDSRRDPNLTAARSVASVSGRGGGKV